MLLDHPYISNFLELLNKWGKTQVRKRFNSPFSLSHIFQCPTQLTASTSPELQVLLHCFYITKVSTPQEILCLPLNLHIKSLHLDKSRVYWKQDKGQYVLGLYILLCWSVYYSILTLFCLKLSENFNSFHFSHTICYTSLHSNITDLPLTYHIRESSLEFYVQLFSFYVSG